MKSQQLTYLSPRLAILRVDSTNKHKLAECEVLLRARHKNYFHIFNLSSYQFGCSNLGTVSFTNFKWREMPYSITEAIKILAALQAYQLMNSANTAIIAVPDDTCFDFAVFVVGLYWRILGQEKPSSGQHPYAVAEFLKVYKTINVGNPPVKMIESVVFKVPEQAFIPMVRVYSESRHNYFEQVHMHNPQLELAQYYVAKRSPLREGVGEKYCDKMPETKHFSKPVLVFGDVKIQVFSYTNLKLQKQFSCGFNTKCLEYEQTLIELETSDLYELRDTNRIGQSQAVMIEVSDYCEKCKEQASCPDCIELVKKLGTTYQAAQLELAKLCKKRSAGHFKKIFG